MLEAPSHPLPSSAEAPKGRSARWYPWVDSSVPGRASRLAGGYGEQDVPIRETGVRRRDTSLLDRALDAVATRRNAAGRGGIRRNAPSGLPPTVFSLVNGIRMHALAIGEFLSLRSGCREKMAVVSREGLVYCTRGVWALESAFACFRRPLRCRERNHARVTGGTFRTPRSLFLDSCRLVQT